MVWGKKISPEMQWAIIRLSGFLTTDQLSMCLGFSTWAINRVNAHFRAYGTIRGEDPTEERKIHRSLRDVDVEVHHYPNVIVLILNS